MPDWSIKIVPVQNPVPDRAAEFVPDINGAKPGDPLKVEVGDLVSWNNTSNNDEHWPWLCADATYQFVDPPPGNFYLTTDKIAPRDSSPYLAVTQPQGTTLYYCCKYHHNEHGRIVVVGFGQSSEDAPSV
jgi:hypothetical protein